MIDGIFDSLYNALMGAAWLAVLASFGWGVLSVLLSPCHLSSIPLIVGFISSQKNASVRSTFYISLVFSIGILVTIAIIGVVTASLGGLMGDIGVTGNYLVAGIFFIVGLYLLEVIKFNWNGLPLGNVKRRGLLTSFSLGLLFGLALGPCTFAYMAPVLGIVFQTSQTNYLLAIVFLFAFSMGHCSVIVSAGTLTGKVQKYLNWSQSSKTILIIKKICGLLVIMGGIYLVYVTL